MKINVSDIRVKERIRKEINGIDELAEDIRKNGLICPIAVMPLASGEYQLLAGLRRLEAIKMLGMRDIECNVLNPVDAETELKIEISEN